ncbi:STAS domain-containing protein [Dasania marina]|uniref:STAS domain-containing protein n=1 Tax=Dasania marina TaxID=471499 RepID=UPI0030DB7CC5|tara:strand:+ start:25084 stop:25578 length:495 start_codon:yes stop_codon:yes gene_type:complete
MQSGKMLVADHQGTYMIKLTGDVRLTLCNTIDEYIEQMFAASDFSGVTVDLAETLGIDSTSLGLLAKLAIQAKKHGLDIPTILSPNPDITRLLQSMGFTKVFNIYSDEITDADDLQELPVKQGSERQVRSKVLEAHKILMGLNKQNHADFCDLVCALETPKSFK